MALLEVDNQGLPVQPLAGDSSGNVRDFDRCLLELEVVVLTMIARDAPIGAILSTLAERAESLEPHAIAGVATVDITQRELEMTVFPSLPKTFTEAIADAGPMTAHLRTFIPALCADDAVTSEDLMYDSNLSMAWVRLCETHGIRSFHSQPLRNNRGDPLGTFILSFPSPRKRVDFNGKLIAACARLSQLALERDREREQRELLFGELQHRIKNLFQSIRALARYSFSIDKDFTKMRTEFDGRLAALAKAHVNIPAEDHTGLRTLLTSVLEPYGIGERIEMDGPDLELALDAAAGFSMAMHELATNAAKYCALSNRAGRIRLLWRLAVENGISEFCMEWVESDGPSVEPPTRRGFGVRVIQRLLAGAIAGSVEFDFDPRGLRFAVRAPFERDSKRDPAARIYQRTGLRSS